jgi:small-conductance mechanosensitive channel
MGRFYFPRMIEVFAEIHAFGIWLVGWILCLLVFFIFSWTVMLTLLTIWSKMLINSTHLNYWFNYITYTDIIYIHKLIHCIIQSSKPTFPCSFVPISKLDNVNVDSPIRSQNFGCLTHLLVIRSCCSWEACYCWLAYLATILSCIITMGYVQSMRNERLKPREFKMT